VVTTHTSFRWPLSLQCHRSFLARHLRKLLGAAAVYMTTSSIGWHVPGPMSVTQQQALDQRHHCRQRCVQYPLIMRLGETHDAHRPTRGYYPWRAAAHAPRTTCRHCWKGPVVFPGARTVTIGLGVTCRTVLNRSALQRVGAGGLSAMSVRPGSPTSSRRGPSSMRADRFDAYFFGMYAARPDSLCLITGISRVRLGIL